MMQLRLPGPAIMQVWVMEPQQLLSLAGNTSTLKIVYSAPSTDAIGYINWIELTYQQQLAAVSDALLFTSPDTTASVEYDLSGFSSAQFSVFDITDSVKVMQPQIDSDRRHVPLPG